MGKNMNSEQLYAKSMDMDTMLLTTCTKLYHGPNPWDSAKTERLTQWLPWVLLVLLPEVVVVLHQLLLLMRLRLLLLNLPELPPKKPLPMLKKLKNKAEQLKINQILFYLILKTLLQIFDSR